MAQLTIINASGHTVVEYDKDNEADVEDVRAKFDDLITQGHLGFNDREPTTTFDPKSDNMTVAPLITGG